MIRLRGFTLMELLITLTIIALLVALATPRYFRSVDRSRDVILQENLRILRNTFDKFYEDKGRYPESLDELVDERYLREVPRDPITEKADTWTIQQPPENLEGAVYDVHSSAEGVSSLGIPYAEM